jgi:hypothetical protein
MLEVRQVNIDLKKTEGLQVLELPQERLVC